jgi:sugar phosphate isomerase/epimerase
MKLSCSSPMVPGETLTAQAEALKEWGYDAISIFYPADRWCPATRDEVLGLEDRTGIVPCEFAFSSPLYGHLMDSDLARRQAARAMYKEAAVLCAELGSAVTELEFEYGPQDPLPLFDPYQALDEGQREAFTEMYLELLEPVQGTDARVLLEPINRYESRYLNSVSDCVDAVCAVSNPRAGLLFDFFHVSIEEANIAESIKQAADLIFHVHLADNNRLLPSMGNIDWPACIEVLRSAGYDGVLNLECSTSGDPAVTLPATAAYLRTLIGS